MRVRVRVCVCVCVYVHQCAYLHPLSIRWIDGCLFTTVHLCFMTFFVSYLHYADKCCVILLSFHNSCPSALFSDLAVSALSIAFTCICCLLITDFQSYEDPTSARPQPATSGPAAQHLQSQSGAARVWACKRQLCHLPSQAGLY